MKHLLVDITAHGYGHIAQTAPVVNELARRIPNLRITVRSAAPTAYLQQRFHSSFQHIQTAIDFGMTMFNAVDVDVPRSLTNYREYHADWDTKVARAAEQMRALQPDLLFANVPYLSLAAAQAAQIHAVAMCCLNWADIYRHYAPMDAVSSAIHAQMLAAYGSAQTFLKVQPTMPMRDLRNTQEISPIAQMGVRTSLLEKVRIANQPAPPKHAEQAEIKWVLVAMGGIDYRLPLQNWPRLAGVRWLIPQAWNIQREDMIALESLGMSFGDVMASSDAVITKPGYGTFAEAACAGIPVLYVSRGEWPEQPYLVDWLQQNGVCREVSAAQLHSGDLLPALQQLWDSPPPDLPTAGGQIEAAEVLAGLL